MIAFFECCGLSGRIGLGVMMLALLSAEAYAERLVTYRFEGVVHESSADSVNEGDRFAGTFTYDLDATDEVPDDPDYGSYDFTLPELRPVGISYAVGGISYTAESYAEIIIFNFAVDPETGEFEESFLFEGFTENVPAGLPQRGSIFLGATSDVFSSDRPPARLDLSDFSHAEFHGDLPEVCDFHHCTDESFEGRIDTLVLVPEPSVLLLAVSASTLIAAARRGSRKASRPGGRLPRLERLEDRLVLAPASPAFLSISDAEVTEGDSGNRYAVFAVSLSGHNYTTTVDYATQDGTATLADDDYRSTSGTLMFRAGQHRQNIRVPVIGDDKLEADETFVVNLFGARGGNHSRISIRDSQGVGTIRNDERGIFVDDFADGNDQGWTHIDFTGIATFDASSGAYRLRTAGALPPDDPSVGTMAATWEGSRDNPAFGHGIVRGTIRANTEGTTAGYLLRANTNPNEDHDYGFFGSSSFGTFYIERFDIQSGGQTIIAMADPEKHTFVAGADYRLEAGVWGDRIWMRAWKVGEARPVLPLLTVRDDTFGPEDGTLLNVIAFFDSAAVTGPVQVDATFDDITFTPLPARHDKHLGVSGEHFHRLSALAPRLSKLADPRPGDNSERTVPGGPVVQNGTHQLSALLREFDHVLGSERDDDGIFEDALALAICGVPGGGDDSHRFVDQVFADGLLAGGWREQLSL